MTGGPAAEPRSPVVVHAPATPTGGAWWVVLTWNGLADTRELLEGLAADREGLTVVVVDNGSADGTQEAIVLEFPWAHFLQTGANLGYAGGNNAGLTYALEQGAGVLGVLNNDTVVTGEALRALGAHVTQHPGDVVSPDIRYDPDVGESWFRGGRLDLRSAWPHHLTGEAQARLPRDAPYVSEILTGCCLVATRQVWKVVGLFDERFFLIFEDSDWSRRAARHARLVVLPTVTIRHKVSRSFTGEAGTLATYYYLRNALLFAGQHGSSAGTTARMLMRAGILPTLEELRDRTPGAAGARAMRAAAVRDRVLGRWGAAPDALVRRARGSR